MKYLFFDIECANCFSNSGKIYSFGYNLTNEKFETIETKDILINPNSDWDWYVVKKILYYDKTEVAKSPIFSLMYEQLKNLIEDKDTILFGYDIINDINFLLDECRRYSLEPFKFKFIDVKLAIELIENKQARSLSAEYLNYCLKIPNLAHRSDSDAIYTSEIFKSLLKQHNLCVNDVFNKYFNATGHTKNFFTTFGKNNPIEHKLPSEKKPKSQFSKASSAYKRYIKTLEVTNEIDSSLQGECFCISSLYEKNYISDCMKLAQIIKNKNGDVSLGVNNSTIFVDYQLSPDVEYNVKHCHKVKNIPSDVKVISFEEMLCKLSISKRDIQNYKHFNKDTFRKYKILLDK